MTIRLSWRAAAQEVAELGLFALALVIALQLFSNVASLWLSSLGFGAIFCFFGAVPFPWTRRVPLVATGAFLAALVIVGYVLWILTDLGPAVGEHPGGL